MDIQAYIQSGIIESYVLGLASAEETAELERLALEYGEIQQAIDEFSDILEQEAFRHAVPPPAGVKENIMAALLQEEAANQKEITGNDSNHSTEESIIASGAPVHYLPATGSSENKWKYIAAASVILFLASAAYNVYLNNKYNEKNGQYLSLLNERNSLAAENSLHKASVQELQSVNQMMTDPSIAKIKLEGVKNKQDEILLLWNTQTKNVFLTANGLPPAASGMQYQLWAIVEGKPVDAGMLDEKCKTFCKMKSSTRRRHLPSPSKNWAEARCLPWKTCMLLEKPSLVRRRNHLIPRPLHVPQTSSLSLTFAHIF